MNNITKIMVAVALILLNIAMVVCAALITHYAWGCWPEMLAALFVDAVAVVGTIYSGYIVWELTEL